MRRSGLLAFTTLSYLLFGAAGFAATPAGTAVGVAPSATDVVNAGSRTLVVGSDVAMGDKIVTGPSGQVQLVFNDQTHLVVGPGSALLIESYLLRGDKSVGRFTVDALGGTYRFITGKSDHSVYTIDTPTGTIGVRGTAFDFTVGGGRSGGAGQPLPGTTVALFQGAVELCTPSGKCVVLDRRCEAGQIEADDATTIGAFQAADLGLRSRFRYVNSQAPLLAEFRIDASRLCFLNTGGNPAGLSNSLGGSNRAPPPPPPRVR